MKIWKYLNCDYMDYDDILKDIKPTVDEKQHIDNVSLKIMNFI